MNIELDRRVEAQDADKQKLRLWLQLLRATRFIETEVRDGLRERFEITLPQFDVMAALYRSHDGLTMTQLSRALRVSNGNITGIVDRLAEAGAVSRTPDEKDRRSVQVALSENGRVAFAAMARVHEGWIGKLLSSFSDQETDVLLALFARFNARGGGKDQ